MSAGAENAQSKNGDFLHHYVKTLMCHVLAACGINKTKAQQTGSGSSHHTVAMKPGPCSVTYLNAMISSLDINQPSDQQYHPWTAHCPSAAPVATSGLHPHMYSSTPHHIPPSGHHQDQSNIPLSAAIKQYNSQGDLATATGRFYTITNRTSQVWPHHNVQYKTDQHTHV